MHTFEWKPILTLEIIFNCHFGLVNQTTEIVKIDIYPKFTALNVCNMGMA